MERSIRNRPQVLLVSRFLYLLALLPEELVLFRLLLELEFPPYHLLFIEMEFFPRRLAGFGGIKFLAPELDV